MKIITRKYLLAQSQENTSSNIVTQISEWKRILLGIIVAFSVVLPSIVWVFYDQSPLDGDSTLHAQDTLQLYFSLVELSSQWPSHMVTAMQSKGPGLAWFGQFSFVVGNPFLPYDQTLRLFSVLIQFCSLLFVFLSVLQFTQGRFVIATTVTVAVGAAPLFIQLSHYYRIEPIQMLSVTWFILIFSFIHKWSKPLILSQVFAASCFALVARATTPFYCVIWGIVILSYLFSPWKRPSQKHYSGSTVATLLGSILLALAGGAWYLNNLDRVINHSIWSASGKAAAFWGKEDTFVNSFAYWLSTLRTSFTISPIFVLTSIVVLSAMGALIWQLNSLRKSQTLDYFTVAAIISVLQISLTLSLFSMNDNRLIRFLLPLFPNVAVILAWAIYQIKYIAVSYILLFVFLSQFIYVNLQAFGKVSAHPLVTVAERSPENLNLLYEIVDRTCIKHSKGNTINILAIDLHLMGDWLGPTPANYTATKLFKGHPPCEYSYVGNQFFGTSIEKAWEDIQKRKVSYIITYDPEVHPPPDRPVSQTLSKENQSKFIETIAHSTDYIQDKNLLSAPGIIIYRRSNGETKRIIPFAKVKQSMQMSPTKSYILQRPNSFNL